MKTMAETEKSMIMQSNVRKKYTSSTNSKSTKAVPAWTLRDPSFFKASKLDSVYPFGRMPTKYAIRKWPASCCNIFFSFRWTIHDEWWYSHRKYKFFRGKYLSTKIYMYTKRRYTKRARERSYLSDPVSVFLTKGVTNCINSQATKSSIERYLGQIDDTMQVNECL